MGYSSEYPITTFRQFDGILISMLWRSASQGFYLSAIIAASTSAAWE